ncbi:hypothetical protein PSY31_22375, partial [Shigella flexneri]|nr:hypothetical protein [Shigella flexneri]
MASKLKRLKVHLRAWNKEVFGHVFRDLEGLREAIQELTIRFAGDQSLQDDLNQLRRDYELR